MRMWFCFFLLFSPLTYAGTDEKDEPENIDWQIEVDPKVYPAKSFDKNGVHVDQLTKKKHKPELPRKEERDKILQQVKGLPPYLERLDEVDKDIFFMNAKLKTIDDLTKLYPSIPKDLLAKIQKIRKK